MFPHFGRLITYPTDGLIIAQPLYVSGVVIPGQGTHNVVFVATENNSVYAFDADSNAGTNGGLLWHTNLGLSVSSYNDQFGNRGTGSYYPDIVPVVGITGTPVIDLASGTLYVNVHTAMTSGTATTYYPQHPRAQHHQRHRTILQPGDCDQFGSGNGRGRAPTASSPLTLARRISAPD